MPRSTRQTGLTGSDPRPKHLLCVSHTLSLSTSSAGGRQTATSQRGGSCNSQACKGYDSSRSISKTGHTVNNQNPSRVYIRYVGVYTKKKYPKRKGRRRPARCTLTLRLRHRLADRQTSDLQEQPLLLYHSPVLGTDQYQARPITFLTESRSIQAPRNAMKLINLPRYSPTGAVQKAEARARYNPSHKLAAGNSLAKIE